MMFRSLVFSCSLLGFLVGGALMAMEDENNNNNNTHFTKAKTLENHDRNTEEKNKKVENGGIDRFSKCPNEIKAIILEMGAYDVGESKGDLRKLVLICKDWNNIVNNKNEQIKHRIKKSWLRGLYHISDPKEVKIFEQFYNGKLIYRPNPESDKGMITLPISALRNPLEGAFDLSKWGEAGKFFSISTGYRKGKNQKNNNKLEMWISPRFLIEEELGTTAAHFVPIMSNWKQEQAPVGMFWTWGEWDNLDWYDYLTTDSMEAMGSESLLEKYQKCTDVMLLDEGWYVWMAYAYISFVN